MFYVYICAEDSAASYRVRIQSARLRRCNCHEGSAAGSKRGKKNACALCKYSGGNKNRHHHHHHHYPHHPGSTPPYIIIYYVCAAAGYSLYVVRARVADKYDILTTTIILYHIIMFYGLVSRQISPLCHTIRRNMQYYVYISAFVFVQKTRDCVVQH